MVLIRSAAAAIAVSALGSTIAAAQTLYSQPPATSGVQFISRTEGTGPFSFTFRRRADNFTIASGGTATAIRWWGGDESADATPDLVNLVSFNIRIYASTIDGGGNAIPGTVLFEQNVSKAASNPTLVPGSTTGLLGAPLYRFETTLSSSLTLAPGVQYWLSVAGALSSPPNAGVEAWAWASSLTGDTIIAQDTFNGAGFAQATLSRRNAAFEIIPSPGTAGLLVIAGLAASRRKRA